MLNEKLGVSALSFGKVDGSAAPTMVTRTNGMTGRGRAMPNGLGALHAPCPIGLPIRRSVRGRLTRWSTAECSRGSSQRADGSGSTRFSDARKSAASISCGCSAQDSAATARSTCDRSAGEARTTSGKARASRNNATSSKARSNRGASAELRSAGHQAICDSRTEDTEAQQR